VSEKYSVCVQIKEFREKFEIRIMRCSHLKHQESCSFLKRPQLANSSSISEFQIAKVVKLWIHLDGQVESRLARMEEVKRFIPKSPFPPLPSVPTGSALERFVTLDLTAGRLAWPLIVAPPCLAKLKPFQHRGVKWLLNGSRRILADEMGLGKTVQAISALRLLVSQGIVSSVLLVCPKSLLANWEAELKRWGPELVAVTVCPKQKDRNYVWDFLLGRVHIMLCNFEQLRTPPLVAKSKDAFDLIIVDEAHRVRNLDARITQGLRQVRAGRFWALTGTPVERDAEDLRTLVSTLDPQRLSVRAGYFHPSEIRAIAKGYLLRRLRVEVLNDLPKVVGHVEVLNLLPPQAKAYSQAMKDLINAEDREYLSILNRLRTICDYDKETFSSIKAERISEILVNIFKSGEKAVVFSYLIPPLEILKLTIDRQKLGASLILEGSMDPMQRQSTIHKFRSSTEPIALLCSLRVAGEGLTLTEANHVIFFNLWWNPSSNLQARDRVVRIGQKRTVFVYRFLCRNTIEQHLENILTTKKLLYEKLIDELAEEKEVSALPNLRKIVSGLVEEQSLAD